MYSHFGVIIQLCHGLYIKVLCLYTAVQNYADPVDLSVSN